MYQRIDNVKGLTYAIKMAGFLATISTVTFAVLLSMTTKVNPNFYESYITLLFSLIGFLSVLGVALLSDYVLDKANIDFKNRWGIFNSGYVIFTILIVCLSAGLFGITYHQSLHLYIGYKNYSLITFIVCASMWLKTMTIDFPYKIVGLIIALCCIIA